jgi:hypothetical protein
MLTAGWVLKIAQQAPVGRPLRKPLDRADRRGFKVLSAAAPAPRTGAALDPADAFVEQW